MLSSPLVRTLSRADFWAFGFHRIFSCSSSSTIRLDNIGQSVRPINTSGCARGPSCKLARALVDRSCVGNWRDRALCNSQLCILEHPSTDELRVVDLANCNYLSVLDLVSTADQFLPAFDNGSCALHLDCIRHGMVLVVFSRSVSIIHFGEQLFWPFWMASLAMGVLGGADAAGTPFAGRA